VTPLRVGRIADLNMYPLYHRLEAAASPGLAFRDGRPAELNAAVLRGELDVSAMSSIEYARNSESLRLLPAASITARGAVASIQLFSRVPFGEVASVAVTPASATSVALLRILLGPEPAFEVLREPPADALTRVDGVLLIGDEALAGTITPFAAHSTDLGEAWRELTGLPMVFAVWAARADVAERRWRDLEALAAVLEDGRAEFARDAATVVAAARGRYPFPADFIAAYLRRLSYDFGDEERAGLGRFLDLAAEAGLIGQQQREAA
jgi:chorismate dehydratase